MVIDGDLTWENQDMDANGMLTSCHCIRTDVTWVNIRKYQILIFKRDMGTIRTGWPLDPEALLGGGTFNMEE